jgi:hypothetical protein
MLQVSRTKKRTHFDPESEKIDDFLRAQKDALLLTVSQYIAKTQTKDETIASLTTIEEQLPKLCSAFTTAK